MKHRNLARFLVFVCLATLGGMKSVAQEPASVAAASPQQPSSATVTAGETEHVPVLQHRNPRYRLHSADVLELSFPFTPEFNQTVTIQPDGFVTLRGVESVRVEGQTIPEVTTSLKNVYAKILHEPVIDVTLKDFEKPFFIVGGEVGHPGKFDLRGETTATTAVAIAGGLKESAKHSDVLLFHRVPDGWMQVKKLNMKKMLKDGNLDEDAYLQPGDFLYVPKNMLSKVERFIPTSSIGMYANPAGLP